MEEPRQHIQIRERAGLEEARLNQDFIEFVTKWSTPLLVVIALIVGGNYLFIQYTKNQEEKLAKAFEQFAAAAAVPNPSPESLRKVAAEFEGVASVAELARLKAGDAFMRAVLRGVKPGADVNQDGTVKDVSDEMTPEDRATFLDSANEQYKLVAEATNGRRGKEVLYVGALFGLASVAESRGDVAAAKGFYEQIKSASSGTSDLQDFAAIASRRIEDLATIVAVAKLPLKASLPPPTKEDAKPAVPAEIPQAPAASDLLSPNMPSSLPTGPAGPPAEVAPAANPVQPAPADPAPATPKPVDPASPK